MAAASAGVVGEAEVTTEPEDGGAHRDTLPGKRSLRPPAAAWVPRHRDGKAPPVSEHEHDPRRPHAPGGTPADDDRWSPPSTGHRGVPTGPPAGNGKPPPPPGYGPGPAGYGTPPPPPGYGPGPDGSGGPVGPESWAPPASPANGTGVAALVVGLVAIPLAVILAPIGLLVAIGAVVLGIMGRRRSARGLATNRGQATAGLWLGVAAFVLAALVMALAAFVFRDLAECLADAGGDEAAIERCQRDFEAELRGD